MFQTRISRVRPRVSRVIVNHEALGGSFGGEARDAVGEVRGGGEPRGRVAVGAEDASQFAGLRGHSRDRWSRTLGRAGRTGREWKGSVNERGAGDVGQVAGCALVSASRIV